MSKLDFSVLTPTYNRAHTLHRTYNSLRSQTNCDFEWIIVDDGSTDQTPQLLQNWQKEANFPVTWIRYSNNRGRNAAVNFGKQFLSGDYTVILDSDDAFVKNALQTVSYWRHRSNLDHDSSVYQLAFRCLNTSHRLLERTKSGREIRLAEEIVRLNGKAMRYKGVRRFEFTNVTKTTMFRSAEFVELTGSEHCPPSITHMKMAETFDTIFVDRAIRVFFRSDGVERISDRVAGNLKNPRGNYLRALAILNDDLEYFGSRPAEFLRWGRRLVKFGLHIGRPISLQLRDLKHVKSRAILAAQLPRGVAGFWWDRANGRSAPRASRDMLEWGPAAAPLDVEVHRTRGSE